MSLPIYKLKIQDILSAFIVKVNSGGNWKLGLCCDYALAIASQVALPGIIMVILLLLSQTFLVCWAFGWWSLLFFSLNCAMPCRHWWDHGLYKLVLLVSLPKCYIFVLFYIFGKLLWRLHLKWKEHDNNNNKKVGFVLGWDGKYCGVSNGNCVTFNDGVWEQRRLLWNGHRRKVHEAATMSVPRWETMWKPLCWKSWRSKVSCTAPVKLLRDIPLSLLMEKRSGEVNARSQSSIKTVALWRERQ